MNRHKCAWCECGPHDPDIYRFELRDKLKEKEIFCCALGCLYQYIRTELDKAPSKRNQFRKPDIDRKWDLLEQVSKITAPEWDSLELPLHIKIALDTLCKYCWKNREKISSNTIDHGPVV